MSHGKQFTLFSSVTAPNGWKVAYVLNALGLTYESLYFTPATVKQPIHTQYNPNGRIPTIIDHKNNDFALWESGAIILYLLEHYDPEHKISVSSPTERASLSQWLFFQTSGQGVYFGQAHWFQHLHPEKLPSAIERYQKEARRILGVLESVLSKQEWLAGGKLTAADISFVPYNNILNPLILGEDFDFEKEFPHTFRWHNKVISFEPVKAAIALRTELLEEEAKKAKA
ncbi:glutathione S-transferase [Cristinia sonorae]|uniref:Glutathione S-transferase n=1 Tax=Cristinia sonorae TaxID=1940300 RepID=A0A8K0USE7_9AGAR|nr:glutathione S-transferase [Cristinia sonorae]